MGDVDYAVPVDPAGVPTVRVQVVCSPGERRVDVVALTLAVGACVGDAVKASGMFDRHPELAADSRCVVALWGRAAALDAALQDGDRIALCRGLQVDPKEARRLRYRAQGPRRRQPRPRVRQRSDADATLPAARGESASSER